MRIKKNISLRDKYLMHQAAKQAVEEVSRQAVILATKKVLIKALIGGILLGMGIALSVFWIIMH